MDCPDCGHSLDNNLHGIDQNDFIYDPKIHGYVYCGNCTFCNICNPRLKKILENAEPHKLNV